ncbi:DUF1684 domain-containing protein [Herbiconiux ginsengi]|uniref:DUF1684 domain-containing protein n=1 Tax=Herbiconiux ginsengi TaxID=381665 RepID=A0A1H3RPL7_9MICO|nr:DUF1684 domain-containing protein [Herbiconiux ginsengi]SDZ27573.1 hypothetical protein SAMN05216554_2973 [Herbiconiux ginsengi]
MTQHEFDESWQNWHRARMRTITGPHGLASLVATHWLTPEPQRIEGLDGEWYLDGAAIVGDDFTIEQGGEALVGGRVLRHFRRDDQVALRVLDPEAPTRAAVAEVDAYMPDEAWVLTGRFTPAAEGDTLAVEEIDGYVENESLAGTVALEIDGRPVEFVATGSRQSMQVVFSDATSGDETYRFRFLRLHGRPGTDEIEVDLNRAYLPPCVFADFYVCALPPAQNRLSIPIRAGEKNVVTR